MASRDVLQLPQFDRYRLITNYRRNLQCLRSGSRSKLYCGDHCASRLRAPSTIHRRAIHDGSLEQACQRYCSDLGHFYQRRALLPTYQACHCHEHELRYLRCGSYWCDQLELVVHLSETVRIDLSRHWAVLYS